MLEIIIIIAIVALDQIAKGVCAAWLPSLPGGSYNLWEGVFHLTYTENKGAAFGILQNARWIFIVITIVTVILVSYFLFKRRDKIKPLFRVAVALVIAGAIGNLIDRIFLGYVRDMFYFVLIDFAIFNVADSAVTVGAVALIIDVIFFKGDNVVGLLFEDKKTKDATDAGKN